MLLYIYIPFLDKKKGSNKTYCGKSHNIYETYQY